MNKWLHAGFILLCGLFLSLSVNAATNKQSLDRIAVILNDTVITQTDLDQAMETIKKQLSASNTPIPPAIVLRKQVLDQLINRKLQLQLAEQSDVTVSDAQITAAINNIAKTNNITADQLYEAVLKQGLTRKDYRKEIHDEILIQEIQQQAVGGKITLQPQEVDDFMRGSAWQAYNTKEYHLEDILIALPETPTPEDIANAKKRAETVLAKLRGGMSFKEAAVSESGDSNALQGGDLGWRKLPEIPSAFAETLTQKKEKDLMGPIQTPNGFHILLVAGIRSNITHKTATAQHKEVEQLLYQRKYEEAVKNWLTKIRSEAFINMHPDQ